MPRYLVKHRIRIHDVMPRHRCGAQLRTGHVFIEWYLVKHRTSSCRDT